MLILYVDCFRYYAVLLYNLLYWLIMYLKNIVVNEITTHKGTRRYKRYMKKPLFDSDQWIHFFVNVFWI